MMHKNKQHLYTIIIAAVVTAAVVAGVRHFHIKHFRCVVPGVLYTSGQPRRMDYTRLLYKYHIGTIVNIRVPTEDREENWYNEEIMWVRENGVNYVELPMECIDRKCRIPDEPTQKKFLEIMAKGENLPVLIHGNSGRTRVSTLAAVWLIKQKGYTLEQAAQAVKRIRGDQPSDPEMQFLRDQYNNRE
ncbi:MAG: dual specificity protein phosphatase family protein [Planctomycetes bacterium]|nr:dual specificity protein phosphatase family protein [Planctomycetota bacterium]